MSSDSSRHSAPAKPAARATKPGAKALAEAAETEQIEKLDAVSPREPKRMRIELSVKSLLTILAIIGGLWLVVHGLPALLVLVTALMLVGALHPLVSGLERRKIGRTLAICLVFGGSLIVAAALLVVTVPPLLAQIRLAAENEPKIRQAVASYLDQSHFTAALADTIRNTRTTELLKTFAASLITFGTHVLEIGAYLVAAFFLAFYMMVDRDRVARGSICRRAAKAPHPAVQHSAPTWGPSWEDTFADRS